MCLGYILCDDKLDKKILYCYLCACIEGKYSGLSEEQQEMKYNRDANLWFHYYYNEQV